MYTLKAGAIIRQDDGAFIPADPRNKDYAEYVKWVDDGNVPQVEVVDAAPVGKTIEERLAALEAEVFK